MNLTFVLSEFFSNSDVELPPSCATSLTKITSCWPQTLQPFTPSVSSCAFEVIPAPFSPLHFLLMYLSRAPNTLPSVCLSTAQCFTEPLVQAASACFPTPRIAFSAFWPALRRGSSVCPCTPLLSPSVAICPTNQPSYSPPNPPEALPGFRRILPSVQRESLCNTGLSTFPGSGKRARITVSLLIWPWP